MNSILGITTLLVISTIFSLIIAFPIIDILYKFKITRRGEVDFSNLIEDRKKKIGTQKQKFKSLKKLSHLSKAKRQCNEENGDGCCLGKIK